MSDPKTPAPDPEIPEELRSKLSKPKRPGGFSPKAGEDAEGDNAPVETEEKAEVRDLSKFFKKLELNFSKAKPSRLVVEWKDVKDEKSGEWMREERKIRVPVKMYLGEDGLPYVNEPVTKAETVRVREASYEGAPPMDRNLGDLTPAFSEWLYLNHSYDAAVRYASRSTHIQAWAVAHT